MRTFIGFGQQAYIGQPQSFPTKLGGISGVVVPLLFQWLAYGASTNNPNINVLVNLDTKPCTALDQIRSIYIDNLGSDTPVYVYFPDTGYTAVAKPNSEGWYPAQTNARQFWVVGLGFLTGDIPQTFIQVSNISFTPSVNVELDQSVPLWRASPTITRGTTIYNSSFGIPALGDQFFTSTGLVLQTPGSTVPLWNTPYPSGFIYVTMLQVWAAGLGGSTSGSCVIESTGAAGTLAQLNYATGAAYITQNGINVLAAFQNMNLKLDATQTWRIRNTNTVASGSLYSATAFTQQP